MKRERAHTFCTYLDEPCHSLDVALPVVPGRNHDVLHQPQALVGVVLLLEEAEARPGGRDGELKTEEKKQKQGRQHMLKSEVDAFGVITISRGCFERCCSNKKTPQLLWFELYVMKDKNKIKTQFLVRVVLCSKRRRLDP